MGFDWIRVSLRSWKPGMTVGAEPFQLLNLQPGDGLQSSEGSSEGQAALIYFVDEELASHTAADEPSAAFAQAVRAGLIRGAAWIESRPAGAFDRCRAAGLELDVFVGGWIDQDQMDLDLPAQFLRACGNAGLAISIVTND